MEGELNINDQCNSIPSMVNLDGNLQDEDESSKTDARSESKYATAASMKRKRDDNIAMISPGEMELIAQLLFGLRQQYAAPLHAVQRCNGVDIQRPASYISCAS